LPSAPTPFPVDPTALAKAYGLRIEMFTLTGVNGILVNDAGTWTIGVSNRLPITRRRFTIAHEVAHYELHRNLQQVFRCGPGPASRLEREANKRAAEILMPEEFVVPWVLSLKPSKDVARHFGVSEMAWERRMLQLCRDTDLGHDLEEALAEQLHKSSIVAPTAATSTEPALRIQVSRKRGRRVVYTYL